MGSHFQPMDSSFSGSGEPSAMRVFSGVAGMKRTVSAVVEIEMHVRQSAELRNARVTMSNRLMIVGIGSS